MLVWIALFIICFSIAMMVNAGIVWALCWALNAMGITQIGGLTVAFSWPLVIVFSIVVGILSSIFGKRVE